MKHHVLSDTLWLRILIGMILGIIVAIYVPIEDPLKEWVLLPGEVFIGLLKMIVVPLVLSSVILGIASAGSLEALRSMGIRLVPYFIFTTAVAITIGMTIASVVQPGLAIDATNVAADSITKQTLGDLSISDRIMNILPTNPMEAQLTKNMLQLIVLGVIVGIALIVIKTKSSKTFHDLCEFTQDACMMVVGWAMWIAPVAVFSLMIKAVSTIGLSALSGMGLYIASVLGGLFCVLCMYLIIVAVIARRNPLTFLTDIRSAQLVAFSTPRLRPQCLYP